MAIHSIVVGVDGSNTGYDALQFALGLAQREGAFLNACFVTHVTTVPTFATSISWNTEDCAGIIEQAVEDEMKRAEVGGAFFLRRGDSAGELRRLADERVADLIIVGRSRHPHLHIGSVPKRLLDDAVHALLIVP